MVSSIFLSACSFEQIFSLLAKSEVEQSAGEQVEFSQTVVDEILGRIDTLKSEFEEYVDLTSTTDEGSFGTGFRNVYSMDEGFEHYVLAVMPNPEGDKFYEGWLVNSKTGEFVSTGVMETTYDGRAFELSFASGTDYTSYSKVVVTLEEIADGNPEIHVIEGDF
jgi:hypothetical protein